MKKYSLLLLLVTAFFSATMILTACGPKDPVPGQEEPVQEEPGEPEIPETPETPENPPIAASLMFAKWENTSTLVSDGLTAWKDDNRFYAQYGDGAGKAYISTFAGNTGGTTPVRGSSSNRLAVTNLAEGDGVEFTWEGVSLSAGSGVEFMTFLMAPNGYAPKYWIFEYFDDGTWKSVEEDLVTAEENASLKYSFSIKYYSDYQYTTFSQGFTLSKAIENGSLKMRIRAVGQYNNAGGMLRASSNSTISFINYSFQAAHLSIYQGIPVKDAKKMLLLGNSFTYSNGGDFLLKQIARSQGHELRMRAHLKGGQTFEQHLALERTLNFIKEGGYDYAVIQDQSNNQAIYYTNTTANAGVLNATKNLVGEIKKYSPAVNPLLENTWAYEGKDDFNGFGSYERFDKALYGGGMLIADACDIWISPIGRAYIKAREKGVSLYRSDDNKHPALTGAYLKACVNYLMIFGEAFDSNAPDLGLDAATAATLRSVAEEVVLGNIDSWRNPDSSGIVPGEGINDGGGVIDPGSIVPGDHGIRNREQLFSFAKVVNANGDISSYCNSEGNVVLLEDIELDGAAWTPIGTVTGVAYGSQPPTPSPAFSGVFDGQNHTISGLSLVVDRDTCTCSGFFGATLKATIKNVIFDGASMSLNANGVSSGHLTAGIVTGYGYDTKIENVSVTADISGKIVTAETRSVAVGGIAGTMASSTDEASVLRDCTFAGTIHNEIATKYATANSGVIAGILGQMPNVSGCKIVKVLRCTNNGTINVKAHRVGGVVSGGTRAHIEDCVNNGDMTVVSSPSKPSGAAAGCRVGGVMAYSTPNTANDYYVKNSVNNGTINVPEASSYVGGISGYFRTYKLEGCINRGNIYTTDNTRGLLVGYLLKGVEPEFKNCSIRGRIGANADSAVEATAENYLSLGICLDGVDGQLSSWNSDNIKFLSE